MPAPVTRSAAILLRESYREAGNVKNRTLANLSSWPEAKIEAQSGCSPAQARSRRIEIKG